MNLKIHLRTGPLASQLSLLSQPGKDHVSLAVESRVGGSGEPECELCEGRQFCGYSWQVFTTFLLAEGTNEPFPYNTHA